MSKVAIKPELIRWARERSGRSIVTLRKISPKYDLWEEGEDQPTLKQLEDLARKTYTPLGYFFLPEPPEEMLPIPDYRTLGDRSLNRPSPNLLETVQMAQRRQSWMRDTLIEEGQKPLAFIGSASRADDPERVALKIRQTLGLTNDWARETPDWEAALRELSGAAEQAGILTASDGVVGNNTSRKLDVKEFRGFVLCDEFAPLIFINASDAKAAQMFTLAHELAHLWLGRGGVFSLTQMQPAKNAVEQFCNRVAAEFLVPTRDLQEAWSAAKPPAPHFQTLARRFKVSPLVIARRALDLGLIKKEFFFAYYNALMEEQNKKSGGGGDFYLTQNGRLGRRFAEAVFRSAKEGRLLYRDAYQLTGLYGATFDQYAKRFEM